MVDSRALVLAVIGMSCACGRIAFDPLPQPRDGSIADGDGSLTDASFDASLCAPTAPTACSACSAAVTCSYAGACCTCSSSVWFCTVQSVDPQCPATPPTGGASCTIDGQRCSYCPSGSEAICNSGNWSVVIPGCGG